MSEWYRVTASLGMECEIDVKALSKEDAQKGKWIDYDIIDSSIEEIIQVHSVGETNE